MLYAVWEDARTPSDLREFHVFTMSRVDTYFAPADGLEDVSDHLAPVGEVPERPRRGQLEVGETRRDGHAVVDAHVGGAIWKTLQKYSNVFVAQRRRRTSHSLSCEVVA